MAIHFRLRELLTAQGMTQTELQLRSGLAYSTINDLYHDKAKRIDVGTVEAVCTVLECGVGDVLEYVPDRRGGKGKKTF